MNVRKQKKTDLLLKNIFFEFQKNYVLKDSMNANKKKKILNFLRYQLSNFQKKVTLKLFEFPDQFMIETLLIKIKPI